MDDLISREAALLALLDKGQHTERYSYGDFWELDFEEIREAMETVPAVEAIPVTWVEDLIRRLRGETAAASRATGTHLEKMLEIWKDEHGGIKGLR